jgi:hypothetical protein
MKKTILQLISLTVLFTGCTTLSISDKELNAAAKAKEVVQAESYSIGHVSNADTREGTHQVIALTLKNPKAFDEQSKDKLASYAAINMLNNLSPGDYKDFDQLKIILEKDAFSFEKNFEIKELLKTISLMEPVKLFFEYSTKKEIQNLRTIVDPIYVNNSALQQIMQVQHQIDSVCGAFKAYSITDYRYEKNNQTNESALIVHSNVVNGTTLNVYSIYILEQKKKIARIAINED